MENTKSIINPKHSLLIHQTFGTIWAILKQTKDLKKEEVKR